MDVSYTYDNEGNVQTITYPGTTNDPSTKTVSYTYDGWGRKKAEKGVIS